MEKGAISYTAYSMQSELEQSAPEKHNDAPIHLLFSTAPRARNASRPRNNFEARRACQTRKQ